MIVIAVLLIGAAAALTLGVLVASTQSAQLDAYVATVDSTVGGVFLIGLVTGLAFLFGLVLFQAAVKRGSRRRHERRALLKEHRRTIQEKQGLEEEKERLRERLGTNGAPDAADTQHTPPPRT
jgi:hypothetical protein